MENGVAKYWTPEAEEKYKRLLAGCRTFAERHFLMTIRDLIKYDGRSKEGKRSIAQARLRLAVATDEDLKDLAELQVGVWEEKPGEIPGLHRASAVAENLEQLKNVRTRIREKGIKKVNLECH